MPGQHYADGLNPQTRGNERMIEEITIKFSPGTNIGAAIPEAWECHAAKGCKVKFNWAGAMIIVELPETRDESR